MQKKVKVAHTRLLSVGFRSGTRSLAVSLLVMLVINPAVGCHYFPPGLQLPCNPYGRCYQFCCLVNTGTMGVNSLPKTVTRQRRDCDLNLGPSAPESSTLTTRLPYTHTHPHTHTHTHGTRKVKQIWISLKQETVCGSGISWVICKSAPCFRQTTTPAPTTLFFTGRMPFLSPSQQRQNT